MKGKRTRWTPAMDAMLGTAPDPEVAAILGLARRQVYRRRRRLGISAHGKRCKLIEHPGARGLLGKIPDREIAQMLGVSREAIIYYRKVRGIGRCK